MPVASSNWTTGPKSDSVKNNAMDPISKNNVRPQSAAAARLSAGSPFSDMSNWLLGLVLVLAVIFAYQPAWNAGYIWDDNIYVTGNKLLSAPGGLKHIWLSLNSPSQYFPMVYTVFRLEFALWGLNSTGYHCVNILLHQMCEGPHCNRLPFPLNNAAHHYKAESSGCGWRCWVARNRVARDQSPMHGWINRIEF